MFKRSDSKKKGQSDPSPAPSPTKPPADFYDSCVSLRLSRERVLENLARTTNPAHRAMLERALADIDAKLAWRERRKPQGS